MPFQVLALGAIVYLYEVGWLNIKQIGREMDLISFTCSDDT